MVRRFQSSWPLLRTHLPRTIRPQIHGVSRMADCQVNLNPTKGVMLQESRCFLHPASLDSVLQLAIIAAHGGRHGSLETGYLPVFVKQMRVSAVDVINEQAVAHAKSGYVDVRTITTDVTMRNSVGTPILTASDIRLAQTQGFTTCS